MKSILPWLFVLALAVALGWQLTVTQKAQADLAALRASIQDVETLRAELEQTKRDHVQAAAELENLRKDNKELLRLRNEVLQLRQEKQQLSKQIQTAQAQTQAAQEQAQAAQQQAQIARQQPQPGVTAAALTAAESFARRYGLNLAPETACSMNLRQIESAKQRWAQENNAAAGTAVAITELAKYLNPVPTCPAGGAYTPGTIGSPPTCSIQGHVMK